MQKSVQCSTTSVTIWEQLAQFWCLKRHKAVALDLESYTMLRWICSEHWWGIRAEEGIYLLILWMSSSRPTRKRKKMSPRSANVSSTATELWGKMVAVKPGMYPRAVGPNKMPPRISAKLLPCPLMAFVKALPKTTYWQATLPWLSIDSPHHFNKRFVKILWFCATRNSSLRKLFPDTHESETRTTEEVSWVQQVVMESVGHNPLHQEILRAILYYRWQRHIGIFCKSSTNNVVLAPRTRWNIRLRRARMLFTQCKK